MFMHGQYGYLLSLVSLPCPLSRRFSNLCWCPVFLLLFGSISVHVWMKITFRPAFPFRLRRLSHVMRYRFRHSFWNCARFGKHRYPHETWRMRVFCRRWFRGTPYRVYGRSVWLVSEGMINKCDPAYLGCFFPFDVKYHCSRRQWWPSLHTILGPFSSLFTLFFSFFQLEFCPRV